MKSTPVLATLGPEISVRVEAAAFPKANLRWFNKKAAENLELGFLSQIEIQNHFWSFQTFKKNLPYPMAMAYHGHQFRHYNPDLGDGRGFLLAQFRGLDGKVHDLSTKGSGTTPYSRRGDGRLTLKGAIRELLASEMLESLGVNTSQTFCIFETGEHLVRPDEKSPTRGAVMTRRMHSSIRFGTFQRLHYLGKPELTKKLVGFCLDHYYPEQQVSVGQNEAQVFLKAVTRKTAELAAQLMMSGYIHAVLNTDNMNISGEVFDFGPYRFMPHMNPHFTAAYFDHEGLYSYARQPESFAWGLSQLAESLKMAYPEVDSEVVKKEFFLVFHEQMKKVFFRRLNLIPTYTINDEIFYKCFFETLETPGVLFETCFFDFHSGSARQAWKISSQKKHYSSQLLQLINKFSPAKDKLILHPYLQNLKPQSLFITEIEAIWQAIEIDDDWSYLYNKIEDIRSFRDVYQV